jgi:phosphopentomutase
VARVFLFIMDGFGIGGAPDAAAFGDEGANTFTHVAERQTLHIPVLASLGLGQAAGLITGNNLLPSEVTGLWGAAREVSRGKDTITGHWEIAGVPLDKDWGYFQHTVPAFPAELTEAIISRCNLPGLLCLAHASGTQVIEDFGEEHIRSGKPIIYTSADSVIQIAAHEGHFGLQKLYDVCKVTRDLTYELNIGRVIARPFIGETAKTFERTGNRKDYSVLPPKPTLLNQLSDAGRDVITIGKIGDIYAHSGTGREVKVSGFETLMATTQSEMPKLKDGGFLMVNFVNFDTDYGHRRDVSGYARALEQFDRWLGSVLPLLREGDRLILTADHGNDPSWTGTDHTREQIPVLCWGPGLAPGSLGKRESFADIGQSIAQHLGIPALSAGTAFSLQGATTGPHTLTRRIAFASLMLLAGAGLAAYALLSSPGRMLSTGEALVGGPFTMLRHTGETVTEKDFLGKPMLVFFGFTYCPDVCPTELQVMAEALRQLGDTGADIQPVFVSVDPARDTPDVLAAYVGNFGDRFIGLTGSDGQVAAMASAYRIYYSKVENKDAPESYLMDHSAIIYLMGADGKFLKHFTYSTDAAALAEGIAEALGR